MNELIRDVISPYFDKIIRKIDNLDDQINNVEKRINNVEKRIIQIDDTINNNTFNKLNNIQLSIESLESIESKFNDLLKKP